MSTGCPSTALKSIGSLNRAIIPNGRFTCSSRTCGIATPLPTPVDPSSSFTACAFEAAEEFMRSPHMTEASCLIADVQLPGMSGVELQTVLCAQGRDTPIIFLSAFQDEAIRASAIKAGAVCFLSKPVDGQILVECLDRALNKRQ